MESDYFVKRKTTLARFLVTVDVVASACYLKGVRVIFLWAAATAACSWQVTNGDSTQRTVASCNRILYYSETNNSSHTKVVRWPLLHWGGTIRWWLVCFCCK